MPDPCGKPALIFGATGLVGSRLLARLVAHERFPGVEAPVRRPLETTHAKLRAPCIDLGRLDAYTPAVLPATVFCCLGTTMRKAGSPDAFRRVDHDLVIAVARLALRLGAEHFVMISALGADRASRMFYNRVKGETEDAVLALGLRKVTVLRPSLLDGSRAESRPAERAGLWMAGVLAPVLVGPLRRYRAIEADTVARAMIAISLAGVPAGIVESEAIPGLAAPIR